MRKILIIIGFFILGCKFIPGQGVPGRAPAVDTLSGQVYGIKFYSEFSPVGKNPQKFWTGQDSNFCAHALLKWEKDTTDTVVYDSIHFYIQTSIPCSIKMYHIKSNWDASEVTWIMRDSSNNWNKPGGDFDSLFFAFKTLDTLTKIALTEPIFNEFFDTLGVSMIADTLVYVKSDSIFIKLFQDTLDTIISPKEYTFIDTCFVSGENMIISGGHLKTCSLNVFVPVTGDTMINRALFYLKVFEADSNVKLKVKLKDITTPYWAWLEGKYYKVSLIELIDECRDTAQKVILVLDKSELGFVYPDTQDFKLKMIITVPPHTKW